MPIDYDQDQEGISVDTQHDAKKARTMYDEGSSEQKEAFRSQGTH